MNYALALVFMSVVLFGSLAKRVRIPWLYGAIVAGFILKQFGIYEPTGVLAFLSELGMYFMLFSIGLEIDYKEIIKHIGEYSRTSLLILSAETIFVSLILIHYFHIGLPLALLIASSFATVGEAMIIPILESTGLIRTKFGKTIVGISMVDDLVELATITIISMIYGSGTSPILLLGSLAILSAFMLLTPYLKRFIPHGVDMLIPTMISMLFLLMGIGGISGSPALAALLAGFVARNFVPKGRMQLAEGGIKSITYGFFAPLFFASVGSSLVFDPGSMIGAVMITLVAAAAKIIATFISERRRFGQRKALILGITLCSRFSTSMVISKYLLDMGAISGQLYSSLIASTSIFAISVPLLLSHILNR